MRMSKLPTNCFLSKMALIGTNNIVKTSVFEGIHDLSAFWSIGTCELKLIEHPRELDQLLDHYLVWYKPNPLGMSGWNVQRSLNYRFRDFFNEELANRPIEMLPERFRLLANSFKKGLIAPVEVLVVRDTSLSTNLIVDGTKRALLLYYLKERGILKEIMGKGHPITILELSSEHCKILFPYDFLKICIQD